VEAHRVLRCRGSHIFWTTIYRWRWGCQPYAPAVFYPQEDSWYSFLLEVDSNQGHSAAGGIRSLQNYNDLIENRTRDKFLKISVDIQTALPITDGVRSKAWTVFSRSNTSFVGSNPTRDMEDYMRLFCVCADLCVGSGLATGRLCIGLRNWKGGQGKPEGCGSTDEWMNTNCVSRRSILTEDSNRSGSWTWWCYVCSAHECFEVWGTTFSPIINIY
jgi:hypothetical protein